MSLPKSWAVVRRLLRQQDRLVLSVSHIEYVKNLPIHMLMKNTCEKDCQFYMVQFVFLPVFLE